MTETRCHTVCASLFAIAALFCGAGGAAAETSQDALRRFALVIGANDGGPTRPTLRYAHDDAKSVARVMEELGGVSSRDEIVLLEPEKIELRSGFDRMRAKLDSSSGGKLRRELLFYFSGHSDETGLMLGKEKVTYRELRALIDDLPADVRIAILDSCASGAMTRGKGGTRRPPFLMDNSVSVRGYAFLTSASADEAAQESQRVGGSFFTHFLVSGLRGAADVSRDSRVTLNEAYQYAFHETLARTESTRAGPQHPNYDFQLAGSGDLVLTDLRGTSALLSIPAELEGRIFIRDGQSRLIAEINKPSGKPMFLALEPGRYDVTLQQTAKWRRGVIDIPEGGSAALVPSALPEVSPEIAVARGDVVQAIESSGEAPGPAPLAQEKNDAQEAPAAPAFPLPAQLKPAAREPRTRADGSVVQPFKFSFVPGVGTRRPAGAARVVNHGAFNLLVGTGDSLEGGEGSFVGAIRRFDVRGGQGAGVFNIVKGNLNGGQGAFGLNLVQGRVEGAQGALAFNFARGGFKGGQVALWGVNVAGGESGGFQGASVCNVAESLAGVQSALGANVARDSIKGLQVGLFNYANEMRGVQIGLINVAKEIHGTGIGLLNFAGNGIFAPAVWAGDAAFVNIGLKIGSPHMYTVVGWATHPEKGDEWDSVFFGLGGHLDFHRFWLELDYVFHRLIGQDFAAQDIDFMTQLRFALGLRIHEQIALFVGPVLNFLVSEKRSGVDLGYSFWENRGHYHSSRLWPGFLAGIQFEPHWGKLNSH